MHFTPNFTQAAIQFRIQRGDFLYFKDLLSKIQGQISWFVKKIKETGINVAFANYNVVAIFSSTVGPMDVMLCYFMLCVVMLCYVKTITYFPV